MEVKNLQSEPEKVERVLSPDEVRLRELLIELKQRRMANPLAFFEPNGKQEETIRTITIGNFVIVLSTGNGVGKTVLAVNVLGNLIYGPQCKWFNFPFFKNFKKAPRIRIVSTHKNIEENIVPELGKWLPPATYTCRKGSRLFLSEWDFANNAKIDIMTYDTDPEQFAGPTIHCHWFDEPPPQAIFSECVARMRAGGFIFITMTPLYSGGWIFDRLNNPWQDQKDWSLVTGQIEDNCIQHGVRGYLEHVDIERIIAEYPPEERDARISGKPIHLTGKVFPTFDPAVHVVEPHQIPAGTLYHVCDPHDRKPFALGWYIVDPTGDVYIVDEWPNTPFHQIKSSSFTVADYKEIIESKEAVLGSVKVRIIDARYGNRKSVQTGDTIRDEFDTYGIHYSNSYTDDNASIVAGHNKIRGALRYDKTKPIGTTNKPKLYFSSNCSNHIYSMLHYTHEQEKNFDKPVKEKVSEKHKDFPDLIRYLMMDNPIHESEETIVEQSTPESWNKFRREDKICSYEGVG